MNKYKRRISHKEIQDLEYDILKEFDKFAKKNGLKYFLSGGSCLGAVRHQDFIPWDDDIDICMLRDDYEKLIKLVKDSRTLEGRPDLQFCLPLDDNYVYPFMKIVNRNTIVMKKIYSIDFCWEYGWIYFLWMYGRMIKKNCVGL